MALKKKDYQPSGIFASPFRFDQPPIVSPPTGPIVLWRDTQTEGGAENAEAGTLPDSLDYDEWVEKNCPPTHYRITEGLIIESELSAAEEIFVRLFSPTPSRSLSDLRKSVKDDESKKP